MSNHHIFALYYPELSNNPKIITITDKLLVDRISKVLRLQIGQMCVLFNQQIHAQYLITEITAKTITGQLQLVQKNIMYQPAITLLLPVLKREALEAAIYGAVEVGVSEIQLLLTQKVQRKWGGQKELERLQRIVIAAAEQAKCYRFASIHEPIGLEQALQKYQNKKLLFADPEGKQFEPVTQDCAVLVGPEGDLSLQEKELLVKHQVALFKLTPTILRACQAAVMSVVLLRIDSK